MRLLSSLAIGRHLKGHGLPCTSPFMEPLPERLPRTPSWGRDSDISINT